MTVYDPCPDPRPDLRPSKDRAGGRRSGRGTSAVRRAEVGGGGRRSRQADNRSKTANREETPRMISTPQEMTVTEISGAGVLSVIVRDPEFRCPGCGRAPWPCYPGCSPIRDRQRIVQRRIAEFDEGKTQ